MYYRFYIDGQLVPDPINWDTFTETLEHDSDIKGILPKYEIKVNFNGKGFKLLFEKYQTEGYCAVAELAIDSSYDNNTFERDLDGLIFLKDVKFSLNKGIAECEVDDNNYGAKIYNNKSIKVYIDTDKTKNGQALTPVPFTSSFFFNPANGVAIPTLRKLFLVRDCFEFLIGFMTDNSLGFESDFLTSLSDFYITTGSLIRKPTDTTFPPKAPFISFKELFSEVNKKYPLAFTVVDRNGTPTIKIEDEDFFYSQNSSGSELLDINDLEQYFNNEVLYSSVKFGGPTATIDVTKHHFNFDIFRTFKEEEYYFTGECNIDKTLDLVGEWIADSNIIEELVVTNTSNTSYDENIFFVLIDPQFTWMTDKQPNPLTGADPYYYNWKYTNDQVSLRHKSFEFFIQDNTYGFRASLSADQITGVGFPPPPLNSPDAQSILYRIKFDKDSISPDYDPGNNYDAANFKYIAPVLGKYTFDSGVSWKKGTGSDNPVDSNQRVQFFLQFQRRNSLDVTQEVVNVDCGQFLYNGQYVVTASASFNCNAGDNVMMNWYIKYNRVSPDSFFSLPFYLNILYGSWFRNVSSPVDVIRPTNGINKPYLGSTLKFEFPISKQQYKLIKSDLSKSILVNNGDGRMRRCWIRRIERNSSTSMADCELITDIIII